MARNPQTTLGKSGKEVRRSTSNGPVATRSPAKTGTGQSGTTEKSARKSDSTKVGIVVVVVVGSVDDDDDDVVLSVHIHVLGEAGI